MTLSKPLKLGSNQSSVILGQVTPPSGLGFVPSFDVNRVSNSSGNKFASSIDWDSYEPKTAVKIRYVDIATGSDSDPGDSWADAWKTLQKAITSALADSDITLVYIKPGKYAGSDGWDNGTINHDFALVAVGDGVIVSSEDTGLSWSVNGTYPNVYEATIPSCDNVVDFSNLTLESNATPLTERTSIANVDSNPGSWYWDGSKVYVRTFDSRGVPDSDIEVYLVNFGASVLALTSSIYLKGLEFRGSFFGIAAQCSTLVIRNCKFLYTTSDNGVSISNTNLSLLQNVESSENWKDGFSYTNVVEAWEENCRGFGNGWDVDEADNSSTTHGNTNIIRIGCEYSRSTGPVVHDIATGDSWCLDCKANNSNASAGTNNAGYKCVTAVMWLDECEATGSDNDLESGTDVIYIKKMSIGVEYLTSNGSIYYYDTNIID